MRKYVLLFAAVVILVSSTGCFSRGESAIEVDGLKYIFGNVKEGTQVVFTFMFKNTGKSDLVIEDLYSSCACVIVKQYDKRVKPGAKGKVYGVIDTSGFSGPMIRAIKLTTNAPGSPVILTLEGSIGPS
jgi:hypothetical protein